MLHEALAADAATHRAAGDLAVRSMAAGRRRRRRRTVGLVAAAGMALVGVVAGSLAISAAVSGDTRQIVTPASGSNAAGQISVHPTEPWADWPRDRVFGAKPASTFFRDLPADSSLLGSGTLPDGIQFRFAQTSNADQPVEDVAGINDRPLWGDEPGAGEPAYRPRAPYFGYEVMTAATYDDGKEDGGGGFWVIIVGQPGTTSADFTLDGKAWQPMQIEHGIAVVKIQTHAAGLPDAARIRLADGDGLYADGPVTLL
jgi:hypothetical protein